MERPFKPGERKKGRVTQVSVNTLKEDREKLGPKKFKELMQGQKKTGMLIGGQVKLDKNKNNKIDAEDFAMLRREKSPMKAKRGKFSDLRKLAKAKGLPAPLMADPKFKFKSAGKLPAASARRW